MRARFADAAHRAVGGGGGSAESEIITIMVSGDITTGSNHVFVPLPRPARRRCTSNGLGKKTTENAPRCNVKYPTSTTTGAACPPRLRSVCADTAMMSLSLEWEHDALCTIFEGRQISRTVADDLRVQYTMNHKGLAKNKSHISTNLSSPHVTAHQAGEECAGGPTYGCEYDIAISPTCPIPDYLPLPRRTNA